MQLVIKSHLFRSRLVWFWWYGFGGIKSVYWYYTRTTRMQCYLPGIQLPSKVPVGETKTTLKINFFRYNQPFFIHLNCYVRANSVSQSNLLSNKLMKKSVKEIHHCFTCKECLCFKPGWVLLLAYCFNLSFLWFSVNIGRKINGRFNTFFPSISKLSCTIPRN